MVKGKEEISCGAIKKLRRGQGFILILQNFSDFSYQGFVFTQILVDFNCNSLGNLSFWKPWNLGYWLLLIACWERKQHCRLL